MQAWIELQYVNCYRLNSDNRNKHDGVKMTRRTTTRKAKTKQNGAATCSHNKNVFSSKMNMATTKPEQKRQFNKRKVQP